MAFEWTRRALLGLASAAMVLVAACGSGSIESKLTPSRILVFGDASADVGQAGGRYTVNDAPGAASSLNTWPLVVASDFGVPLSAQVAGGTGYATGNARVLAKPDAAGDAATRTVKEQIDAFLAGNTVGGNDLVLMSAGFGDIIAEMAKVTAGTQTGDQMVANVRQAARDFASQVIRVVGAGGAHVGVLGVYDLGKTPWANAIGQQALLSQASSKFNEELLVSLVNQGRNVLYIDAALLTNLMIANPTGYSLANAVDPVCTSVDPGPGIGTGSSQLNSKLCNTTTLVAGASAGAYLYADRVYMAPQGHIQLGNYAYTRIRERW